MKRSRRRRSRWLHVVLVVTATSVLGLVTIPALQIVWAREPLVALWVLIAGGWCTSVLLYRHQRERALRRLPPTWDRPLPAFSLRP